MLCLNTIVYINVVLANLYEVAAIETRFLNGLHILFKM